MAKPSIWIDCCNYSVLQRRSFSELSLLVQPATVVIEVEVDDIVAPFIVGQ